MDLFTAYAQALPASPHRPFPKGEGQTNIVEALNCSLRQRCGVLVRKSFSFSKSLPMHTARIKTCIEQRNQAIMLLWTTGISIISTYVNFINLEIIQLKIR